MTYPLWTEAERSDPARFGTFHSCIPSLAFFPADGPSDAPRGAVIVCPGGGYVGKAPHEAEPIARALARHSIHAFLLDYRVEPDRHPAPLSDARRAIRVVRQLAPELKIRPDRVGILGFSAGGHLAGSAAFCRGSVPGMSESIGGADAIDARPDAAILCYAVLSFLQAVDAGTRSTLLGPGPDEVLCAALSCERSIDATSPPAFLWSTVDDEAVDIRNSLMTAEALSTAKIPFEMHLYPQGRHGLGLARGCAPVSGWLALCAAWLHRLGF
jgi:acetyl esterase/lipase